MLYFLGLDKANYDKDIELFDKMAAATLDLKSESVTDVCDEIKFEPITRDSYFQSCLITNTKKDSFGYNLFCMIKFLCDLQNLFLENISSFPQYEWLKDKLSHKIPFMELSSEQIIKTTMDYDEIVYMIEERSYSDLRYGKGKFN